MRTSAFSIASLATMSLLLVVAVCLLNKTNGEPEVVYDALYLLSRKVRSRERTQVVLTTSERTGLHFTSKNRQAFGEHLFEFLE